MDGDVTVRDVIAREYVGVDASDSVRSAVQLMREQQAASVLVTDDGRSADGTAAEEDADGADGDADVADDTGSGEGDRPVGIVTEYDVLGVVADGADPGATPVADVMSSPVEAVGGDTALAAAAGRMSAEGIRNLLVEDADGTPLGVLTDRDVIAAVASLQRTRTAAPGGAGPAGPLADRDGADVPADPGGGGGTGTPAAGSGPTDGTASRPGGPVTNEAGADGPGTYTTQGVCEVCGTLQETLYEIDGRLVCPDCHER